ncbi:O-unit flippase [Polaribacter pacificus]|uniref:O-unit flippase n=1 Tax=Polaribacter pacificus TaxID=1775173 RepID=A0A917HTJ4_9FLAO|nr:polysaccharide biosynthesis C-terminal domain-containing protein [Polaribacter pacificus]GGG89884.1 O-unit flippase [Polaribacter pacificus]
MNLLKNYIQNFLSRAGSYVFITTIIARLFSFLASWIAVQLIPNNKLGVVLFAFSIIAFVFPIAGLGLHQSYLRFGALLKTNQEKEALFVYVFKKGIRATIIIILSIIVLSYFFPFTFEDSFYYITFLSLALLPSYVFELIKIQFRLQYKNKEFAYTEIVYNLLLVIFVGALSYFYKEKGYAAALVLTPLLACLYYVKKLPFKKTKKTDLSTKSKDFWSYGIFASLSNVVTQLLFVIDILLIGYLLNDAELVTVYKYLSLIPLSLLFLPRVFINTDFVHFTANIKDLGYIKNYIKGYLILFGAISCLLILFFNLSASAILQFFDPTFSKHEDSFMILLYGVVGILFLRGLFGNLLSSIGKAHLNLYITLAALILNICANLYMIPNYGIKGAAITSACLMWITGILSFVLFMYCYKSDFLNKK